jgi:hypothetical protein
VLLKYVLPVCAAFPIYAWQCDCVDIGAAQAKRGAQIVFQGTVTDFRDSPDGHRVAVFRVSRVWKGHVTPTFEMPANQGTCFGFYPGLLKIGNELLVFASRFPGDDYDPEKCSTKLIKDVKDIRELGPGQRPK